MKTRNAEFFSGRLQLPVEYFFRLSDEFAQFRKQLHQFFVGHFVILIYSSGILSVVRKLAKFSLVINLPTCMNNSDSIDIK